MGAKIRVKKAFAKHLRSFCKLIFLVFLFESYSFAFEIMISRFHFINPIITIMRNLFTSLLLLASIITVQSQTKRIIATNDMTAREIIEKNAYIAFTRGEDVGFKFPFVVTESALIATCSDSIANPSLVEWSSAWEQLYACSKMRAAHYRLYETLSLDEEKRLITTAKSAADLNISEPLFKIFMQQINQRNKSLQFAKENYASMGLEIYLEKDMYLKALLVEPIDYSKVEFKDNGLTAQEMVEKNVFIKHTVEELNKTELNTHHPAWRAARYRFCKHIEENEEGLFTCSIKNGAELNISEDLFNHFKKDLEWVNEGIKRSINNGDTPILKPKYDENYLNQLLDDNFVRFYLTKRTRVSYYPQYNTIYSR